MFRNGDGSTGNWRFYLPFLGLIVGMTSIIITFALMQGLENEIFNKLKSINYTSKILDDIDILDNSDFTKIIKDKCIISKHDEYRIVNAICIEKFDSFLSQNISKYLNRSNIKNTGALIGSGLANKLGVTVGDSIQLTSPVDVNLITGIPTSLKIEIIDIYTLNLLNYDDHFLFTNLNNGEKIFKSSKIETFSNLTKAQINEKYPNLSDTQNWEHEHSDFISAMKLEKLAFSLFGFIIVLLSSFSSFSIMCISVMRHMSDFGILRTFGLPKFFIVKLNLFQSLLIGILGGFVSILISILLIELDSNYSIIQHIFSSQLPFDFNLSIKSYQILFIYFMSSTLMVLAGFYPSYIASKMSIIKSINFNR